MLAKNINIKETINSIFDFTKKYKTLKLICTCTNKHKPGSSFMTFIAASSLVALRRA